MPDGWEHKHLGPLLFVTQSLISQSSVDILFVSGAGSFIGIIGWFCLVSGLAPLCNVCNGDQCVCVSLLWIILLSRSLRRRMVNTRTFPHFKSSLTNKLDTLLLKFKWQTECLWLKLRSGFESTLIVNWYEPTFDGGSKLYCTRGGGGDWRGIWMSRQ